MGVVINLHPVDGTKLLCKLKVQTMTKKMVKLTSTEKWLIYQHKTG